MLTFDTQRHTLHYAAAGCTIAGWQMAVEADGVLLRSPDAQVATTGGEPLAFTLAFPVAGLAWHVRCQMATGEGRVVIETELENRSDRAIRLGKAHVLDTDGPVGVGEPCAEMVCLPLSGEIGNRPVWRLADSQCPRTSKIKAQFFNRAAAKAMQVGFLTFQRANTEVEHAYDAKAGITALKAWCDFAGWELAPGQSTPTETFTLAAGHDPHAQLAAWADLAAARCSPRRWEDAPIGWIGWAWVDPFNVERYQDVLLRNCQAIRRRLEGFGVNYVWLSIGNLARGIPGDWLNWNTELFPDGPQHLAARLREMGFRWGLWCGAFWMCSMLDDKVEALRDALLKNPDGSLMVVRPEWQFGAAGEMPKAERPCMYALDPSHPKALALLKEVFEAYRRWGVRYYMLDFLHAASGDIGSHPYTDHHDKGLVAGPEAYHNALRVIRQAAGDDTYFLSSTGPTVHNVGIMDAVRTGNDFGEGRALYPDSYFYPATFVINSGAFWTGALRALVNQASAYYTHRKLYINDSGNVLTVDKPLPLRDARVHATIHALSGGPSMLGDDVDRMDDERLALIKKTLPRSRDVAAPVDLFDSPMPDHPKVFHRKILKPWGRFDVVAVYNFTDDLLRQPVELARLGLEPDADYLVWEFWNAEFVGTARDVFEAVVPPGSVRVFRLVEDTGQPVLVGTDMHVLMGEMEIDRCAWDADRRVLSGRAIRPSGETGNVFLHAPPTLRVANPRGHWLAKDARDSSLIIRCSLRFEDGAAEWAVQFAGLAEPLDMDRLDLT